MKRILSLFLALSLLLPVLAFAELDEDDFSFEDVDLDTAEETEEAEPLSDELKEELLAYISQHVAKYAMPREIEFRKELPKTLVGKVAYRVLEEEANAALQ